MLHATAWAQYYHSIGFNPLPSRRDRKGPVMDDVACYRDGQRIPEAWVQPESMWQNIQLCLGVAWGLLVVDVDGLRALREWSNWHMRGREWPETWTVRSRRGRHYYYRIPKWVATCPSRPVWLEIRDGRVVKHSEIRILGDKALVVAPPSRHIDPPHPVYAFLEGRQPGQIELATAPEWLFRLPEQKPPRKPWKRFQPRWNLPAQDVRCIYQSIEAIPPAEKIALARSWGLRTACAEPNLRGWISCHALDREDAHPSASLHVETGVFWQAGEKALSFPALAVALGAAHDVRSAMAMLGIERVEVK